MCYCFSEKMNIKFVPAEARAGLLSAEESRRLKKLHEDNKELLRIPRRYVVVELNVISFFLNL